MLGSIERIWQLFPKRSVVSAMALVVSVNTPDPTRRETGYGGVIPVPGPAAPATTAPARLDPILEQQRRDTRAVRGRVLYATGHAPRDTTAARTAPVHKGPCPDTRVGQGRASTSMPNS